MAEVGNDVVTMELWRVRRFRRGLAWVGGQRDKGVSQEGVASVVLSATEVRRAGGQGRLYSLTDSR